MTDLLAVLLEMRSGAVAADLSAKFSELMAAVVETGAGGELTIKLKVRPSGATIEGVREVELAHECRLKKPQRSFGKSMFFVGREGQLSRHDPNQIGMFGDEQETGHGNGRKSD